jgi:uncharacterized protein (TIGR00255 family)
MLRSMTGYGTAVLENEEIRVVAEVKSLNSKFLDANIRLPRIFSDKELEVRNLLGKAMERGKVSINIEFSFVGTKQQKASINKELATEYFEELSALSNDLGAPSTDLFKTALQMPMVIDQSQTGEDPEGEWHLVKDVLLDAINKCNEFRDSEGNALEEKLLGYITNIETYLQEVIEADPERVQAVRERIQNHITEYLAKEEVDTNRFEQEMIFYIEKLDISEEKVRLQRHLDYFREVAATSNNNGKKLGFIGQEIGREINTIGSKANSATIQRSVVNMKDELEKIKEQTLNIL